MPAAVAARDMRLVRDAEVAKELGATVTTKAERELVLEGYLVKLITWLYRSTYIHMLTTAVISEGAIRGDPTILHNFTVVNINLP